MPCKLVDRRPHQRSNQSQDWDQDSQLWTGVGCIKGSEIRYLVDYTNSLHDIVPLVKRAPNLENDRPSKELGKMAF